MMVRAAALAWAALPCRAAYTCEPEVLGVNGCDRSVGPPGQSELQHLEWWNRLTRWADDRRAQLLREQPDSGDFSAYENPDIDWARTAYVQPQSMIHDRYLYDPATDTYTVDRFLDDLQDRYGGIDAVLLWQGYPNLGADDQNNFDMLRSLPGGIEGLRGMVAQFHARGVRVLWPNFVWDTQTRPEGATQAEALTQLVVSMGADGINGDTMDGLNYSFWSGGLQNGKGLALEAQSMGRRNVPEGWTNVTFNVNSWAENWNYQRAPLVSTFKLLDSRHTPSITERSQTNRTDGLQHAFFNGMAYTSWESVWGFFNLITPRYSEALRRIAKLQRQFGDLLGGAIYRPHVPYSLHDGVYVAEFGRSESLIYMIVNRNGGPEGDRRGDLIRIPCPSGSGVRYFDVYHGFEFDGVECSGGYAVVRYSIEALGFGAVLACQASSNCMPPGSYLEEMRHLTRRELRDYGPDAGDFKFLPQSIVPNPTTRIPASTPPGTVLLPAGDLEFDASYGGRPSPGVTYTGDVQFPWESSPRTRHRQLLAMHPLYMDVLPVTNADYHSYLVESGYIPPVSRQNWLKHWNGLDFPPPGGENKPVTWVSRNDAIAYCEYYGKRLPHTWEWQWAAQGQPSFVGRNRTKSTVPTKKSLVGQNRTAASRWRQLDEAPPPPPPGDFPWCRPGQPDECFDDPTRYPPRHNNGVAPPPHDVGQYPSGSSAFGVQDLMYSVWQWTDEFCDDHTCVSLVRGGSSYSHQPAGYYFPRPTSLSTHQTWLMMSESMDRKGTFSFRCVADAVAPRTCPWQLCGKVVDISPGSLVDLTTVGRDGDWVHFGRETALDVNFMLRRDAGGTTLPPTIGSTVLNHGLPNLPVRYSDNAFPGASLSFAWNNGAVVQQESGSATGIFVSQASGLGGFRVTVPTTIQNDYTTLRIYVGVFGAQGRLTASLSAGETVFDEVWPQHGPSFLPRKAAIELTYRSTDAWPLSVSWAIVNASSPEGHISLLGAALSRDAP